MKEINNMSYKALSEIIIKPWIDIKGIKLLACCGRNSAINIRKKVEEEIIKKGNLLPQSSPIVVPTKEVLNCLGLDANYIIEMALKEKQLEMGCK